MLPSLFLPVEGVVPVFVNAGAAVLPAVVGALASALALLLKPKELLAVFRRKPYIPLLVVALGALLFVGGKLIAAAPARADHGNGRSMASVGPAPATDWTKVALELIRQEQLAARQEGQPRTVAPAPVQPATTETPGAPVIFRGDAQRSGYLGGPSPVKLVEDWRYGEDDTMYLASPLLAGDTVFGASAYLDPPRSYGSIFALDAATGTVKWQRDVKVDGTDKEFSGFFSSPALSADGRSLIIGQGLHADSGAELVCLDAETGQVRWLVPTPLHVESSPAIEGDIVVAAAGAVEKGPDHKVSGDPNGIGNPGYVFGVSISTGKQLWRYPLNDPESSPAIKDGVAYIGSGVNGNAIAAVRIAPDEALAAQGLSREVWKVDTPFPAIGPVTLYHDLVLIGCGNGDFVFAAPKPAGVLLALDQKTGEVRWSVDFPDGILNAVAVVGDVAVCPVRNGELVAIDLKEKGRVLWRQQVSGKRPVLAAPAFTGSHVYGVSSDGYLAIFKAASGELVERHYINDQARPGEQGLTLASPLVANGKVLTASETGGLRCYSGQASP